MGVRQVGQPRLTYQPGLDGIRAIAVFLVLITHARIVNGAGWVGVTMFFVLSGYLITRLLLMEARQSGGIALIRFCVRRAGRLLPALFAMVAVVTIVNLARGMPAADVARDSLVSATYVSSWLLASGTPMIGVAHTWSLSIEEQFYLVWPLVLGIAIRRNHIRLALVIAILAGIGSALWRDMLWASGTPWQRFAFGPDAEIDGLMVGCALAIVTLDRAWHPSPFAVLVAGAGIVFAIASQNEGIGLQAVVGIPVAIAATAVFVLAADRIPGLASPPVVYLGTISYGVYIWGSPLFTFADIYIGDVPGFVRLAVLMPITIAIATVSYRWLEKPIRDRVRSRVGAVVQLGQQIPEAKHR